jgi:hypothetical protein
MVKKRRKKTNAGRDHPPHLPARLLSPAPLSLLFPSASGSADHEEEEDERERETPGALALPCAGVARVRVSPAVFLPPSPPL